MNIFSASHSFTDVISPKIKESRYAKSLSTDSEFWSILNWISKCAF